MNEPVTAKVNERPGDFSKMLPQPKHSDNTATSKHDIRHPAVLHLSNLTGNGLPTIAGSERSGVVHDIKDNIQPVQHTHGTVARPASGR